MGKPRMIILIRHAQSEGNLNRDVHQIVPDHRVKLTSDGWRQAEDAGRRLREMLRPDDTIRIFTSPYRRTRETTEGLLKTLTESHSDEGPSPFPRSAIKVYEEPRLREQDFGNFQPCSAEMERMWQERADYGHFFYRIPNGESAADAYDRCSGFNESLWRNFGEDDFPSICVLVTHGLMTRVFLMKWYHWSVEYFEDLRNVNHCEFVVMKRGGNGKFALQTKLRTWSEMKRKAAVTAKDKDREKERQLATQSSKESKRIWGGCVDGCTHDHKHYPRRARLAREIDAGAGQEQKTDAKAVIAQNEATGVTPVDAKAAPRSLPSRPRPQPLPLAGPSTSHLRGRDAGGSESGLPTPSSETFDAGFPHSDKAMSDRSGSYKSGVGAEGSQGDGETHDNSDDDDGDEAVLRLTHKPRRRPTVQDLEAWKEESGMGRGTRADALGDPEESEDGSDGDGSEYGQEDPEAFKEIEREEEEDKSVRGSVY